MWAERDGAADGVSARLHGMPRVAGTSRASTIPAGRTVKVKVILKEAAETLLRRHRRLTLSVTASLKLGRQTVRETFVITVKLPPHHRR